MKKHWRHHKNANVQMLQSIFKFYVLGHHSSIRNAVWKVKIDFSSTHKYDPNCNATRAYIATKSSWNISPLIRAFHNYFPKSSMKIADFIAKLFKALEAEYKYPNGEIISTSPFPINTACQVGWRKVTKLSLIDHWHLNHIFHFLKLKKR